MNLKTAVVLTVAMLAVSVGEMNLSRGMKELGEVSMRSAGDAFRLVTVVFRNRHVALSVVLLSVYFYSFASMLSWADLSFVLPLTSISFILGTLLAKFCLNENVTPTRWLGTVIICVGVALVASGEAKTKQKDHSTAVTAGPAKME